VALCAAVLDHHILTLYKAGFTQPNAERDHLRGIWAVSEVTKVTDHRHRLLLRGGNARRSYRATKQGNEAPTVHSILMQSQPRENLAQRDTAAGRWCSIEDIVSIAERACGNGGFRVEPLRSWA
jgi:hypothetical protein